MSEPPLKQAPFVPTAPLNEADQFLTYLKKSYDEMKLEFEKGNSEMEGFIKAAEIAGENPDLRAIQMLIKANLTAFMRIREGDRLSLEHMIAVAKRLRADLEATRRLAEKLTELTDNQETELKELRRYKPYLASIKKFVENRQKSERAERKFHASQP